MNPAMAAKPLSVIELSNGYPSGPHHELNLQGKTEGYICETTEGGNSVFIRDNGNSTISYVTIRQSTATEPVVLDQCAEAFDGNPARIQLPYEPQGYYVFGIIKGKPGSGGEKSSIIYPNLVREACIEPDTPNPNIPTYTECWDDSLLMLGLIIGNDVYEATDVGFVRFEGGIFTGKGKSKGTNISSLFMWTGWTFDATLDVNGDGQITEADVPLSYDLLILNNIIEIDEFQLWLADQEVKGLAVYYDNEWIMNIADLVETDQLVLSNGAGAKLFKIRFYPVATTEYLTPSE
jgi:hypothetical protein